MPGGLLLPQEIKCLLMRMPILRIQASFLTIALMLSVLPVSAASSGAAATGAAAAGGTMAGSSGGGVGSATTMTSGPQNTSTFLKMRKNTLFVLAFGGDPGTTNYVAYETALLLNNKIKHEREVTQEYLDLMQALGKNDGKETEKIGKILTTMTDPEAKKIVREFLDHRLSAQALQERFKDQFQRLRALYSPVPVTVHQGEEGKLYEAISARGFSANNEGFYTLLPPTSDVEPWQVLNKGEYQPIALSPENVASAKRLSSPNSMHYPEWVLPEPAWTLSDFTTQCANDPKTAGALILYDIENDSGSFSYIISQWTYTHLYAKSILVNCERYPSGYPQNDYFPDPTASPSVQTLQTIQETITTPTSSPAAANSNQASQSIALNITPSKAEAVWRQSTPAPKPTKSPTPQASLTITSASLPTMEVVWQNDGEQLDAAGRQGSMPLLGIAALGAYLSAQSTTKQTTTTTPIAGPVTPAPNASPYTAMSDPNGSQAVQTSKNFSGLPIDLALIAGAAPQLGSAALGGMNPTRVLKIAAAELAGRLINLLVDASNHDPSDHDAIQQVLGVDPSMKDIMGRDIFNQTKIIRANTSLLDRLGGGLHYDSNCSQETGTCGIR
jgi:hypothetical protein